MHNRFIRPMELEEVKEFYDRIEKDFLPGEYAPYDILFQQVKNGLLEGMVYVEEIRDLAYSISTVNDSKGYVLISLLGVYPEYRGKGVGSSFLKALGAKFEDKQAIIVEVERPDLSQSVEEKGSRLRRIEFYEKAGYYVIPEVNYTIWDIPMHIMALPLKALKETINRDISQIMYQLYYPLLGKRFLHKMSCNN